MNEHKVILPVRPRAKNDYSALHLLPALLVIALMWGAIYYMYIPAPQMDLSGLPDLTNIGTYTKQEVQFRYDRISFCDANGKQVVVVHLDTGDIVHSFDSLDKAGQEAADAFWGAFGARLKKIR